MNQARTASFQPQLEGDRSAVVRVPFDFPAVKPEHPSVPLPEWKNSSHLKEEEFTRAYPRDLFDVRGLFERGGLTAEVVECFVSYLAGHNRPVHEDLFSRD